MPNDDQVLPQSSGSSQKPQAKQREQLNFFPNQRELTQAGKRNLKFLFKYVKIFVVIRRN